MANNPKNKDNPPPEARAPRRRLTSRLSEAAKKKLILVYAPAGSGKTSAVSEWIGKTGRGAAWVKLDAPDNAPALFYRALCSGIASLQPGNTHMPNILRSPDFEAAPMEHTVRLLAEFLVDEREYALVLDDFHTLENAGILKSLPYILRRMPPSFVTLVLGRGDLGEAFADLAAEGEAELVGPDDLALGREEVSEYFRLLGHGISGEEAETVLEFTGGWAAGVSAIAKSAKDKEIALPADDRIYRYISKNIWEPLDEDSRAHLLAAAVLDALPSGLCEAVAGAGAEKFMDRLERQHTFISKTEDGVYRFHRLFLEFLRGRAEYAKAQKGGIFQAAAKYHAQKGEYFTAFGYACKSARAGAIAEAFGQLVKTGDYPLGDFLECAENFFGTDGARELCEKEPMLCLMRAWAMFLRGEVPLPESIAEGVFAPINLHLPFLHRSCRDFCEFALEEGLGEMPSGKYPGLFTSGVMAGLLLEQNKMEGALTELRAALAEAKPAPVELRFSAYMQLADVYFAMGREKEFSGCLGELERLAGEKPFMRPNLGAFVAKTKFWEGDIQAARGWVNGEHAKNTESPELYRIYQHFATVRAYAVLGETGPAVELATKLRELAQKFGRTQDAAEAGMLLAALFWEDDDPKSARDMMESVLLELQPYGFMRLVSDEGAAVLRVLKKIQHKTATASYNGGLDPAYVNSVYIAAYATAKKRPGIMAGAGKKPVKLSNQQKMIVQLLSQGYKRKDIIAKTGLSLGTVKSYTRIAFEKLEADNAASAVMRARELGIIK